MSRTDKTRPWHIKVAEADAADPYGARQGGYPHAPGIWGCPSSCYMCRGSWDERRRERREGRRLARELREDA